MITRRDLLKGLVASSAMLVHPFGAFAAAPVSIKRPIPSSGEPLPVIGMGSSGTFNVGSSERVRTRLREVLQLFFEGGGTLIDTSPMYGTAESVLGEVLTGLPGRKQLFAATKVWTDGREAGIAQMRRSMVRMRVARFDLIQIHNLRDWRTHLPTLRQWKADGFVRYVGITTSHGRSHSELVRILETEPFDFVQFSYSLATRAAARRSLPLARERGIAVLVNRAFQRGAMFHAVRGRPLPSWAAGIDCTSWAQVFLKFVVSHPAVTCTIPATSKPKHMRDNMRANFGRLPDAALRRRMVKFWDSL
ncbi:MAG: aldo/keto reductase [Acidiferrobacterales bacterium]